MGYKVREKGYEYNGIKLGDYCKVGNSSEDKLVIGFAKEDDDLENDKDFIILQESCVPGSIKANSACATDVLIGHEEDLYDYYSLSELTLSSFRNYPSNKLTRENIDYAQKYYNHYLIMLKAHHLDSTDDNTGWITDSVTYRIMDLLGLSGNDRMFEDEFFDIISSGIQYKNDFEIVIMSIKSSIEEYNKGGN